MDKVITSASGIKLLTQGKLCNEDINVTIDPSIIGSNDVTLDEYLSDTAPAEITINASSLGTFRYLFYGSTTVQKIYFPNLTEINQLYQLYNTHISEIRFGAITTITGTQSLNLAALNKLIIETPTLCALTSATLSKTDLNNGAAGTGIFVPDNLVDSYKGATNWIEYADYIHPMSELGA